MKVAVFVCLIGTVFCFYTDVDDTVDVDKLLNDKDLMEAMFECFVDKGPCSEQMMGYKKHITEALANKCKDCSPSQKHKLEELYKGVMIKYPEMLEELKKKFDPDGTLLLAVAEELVKY